MAIVQAGKQFTAADLQLTAGNLAAMILDHVQSGHDLAVQLASWSDADLLALGLTQEQTNAIKGFYVGDLPAVAAALAASQWIKQLVGLGV
jgi:uncharacterized membrane-anchored protein